MMKQRSVTAQKKNNINKIKIGNDLLMEMEVGNGWTITDALWGQGRCAEEIDKLVVIFERVEDEN